MKSNPSSGLLARFCSKVVAGHQGRGALVKVNKPKHARGVRRFREGFLGRDFRQPYSRHSEDLDACPLSSLYERMTGEPLGSLELSLQNLGHAIL